MNIKKILAALLAVTLCAGLSACGGKKTDEGGETASEVAKYGIHLSLIHI